MLDLNHPMTEHIFAAARMKDRVLVRVERMTTEPYPQNLETLDEARQMLPLLRQLNEEHFQSSRFIFEAIDALVF